MYEQVGEDDFAVAVAEPPDYPDLLRRVLNPGDSAVAAGNGKDGVVGTLLITWRL